MISRIDWVDYAKGVSMILVVLHHVIMRDVDSIFYSEWLISLNDNLKLFRMPLFFFLSGLFIYKGLTMDLKSFFNKKIKNLLFVYTIWNIMWYFLMVLFLASILRNTVDLGWILSLYYNPPIYWFLYALIIFSSITYLFRNKPWLALALSLIGFAISISNGNHHRPTFLDEVMRYYPMYLVGYYFSKNIVNYSRLIKKRYVIILPLYLYVVGVVLNSSLNNDFLFILPLMLLGIILGISLAKTLVITKSLGFFGFIGRNTLPIYILHVYPTFIFATILTKSGLESIAIYTVIQFLMALMLPIIVFKIIEKTPLKIMFNINVFKTKSIQKTKVTSLNIDKAGSH